MLCRAERLGSAKYGRPTSTSCVGRYMKFDFAKLIRPRLLLLALVGLAALAQAGVFSDRHITVQSRESYEAAIHNDSTSPSYVMISVAGAETEPAKVVCITANFLLGAIHREYGLGYDAAGVSEAIKIALANSNHRFAFRQLTARANIPTRYSDGDLAAARKLLAPIPTDELKRQFSSLSRESRLPTNGYNQDAIACALIERGLSPRLSDLSGQVYIAREQNEMK